MRIEWRELIKRCPEIAGLTADAQSIAENERTAWYERWLPSSTVFADAVRAAAVRLGVDREEVRPVALAGLVDAYRTAKQRLQRKRGQQRPAPIDYFSIRTSGNPRETRPGQKSVDDCVDN